MFSARKRNLAAVNKQRPCPLRYSRFAAGKNRAMGLNIARPAIDSQRYRPRKRKLSPLETRAVGGQTTG
eukprot:11178918-Lingulodinium_polyedra.AAC.1